MNQIASRKIEISRPVDWEMEGPSLSSFLTSVHDNQVASFVRARRDFDCLNKIDQCFHRFIRNNNDSKTALEAALLARAHGSFKAACGTALAGQCVETFVLIRPMIEYSAVALRIFKNSKLGEVFLQRHKNDATYKDSKKQFHPKELEETVRSIDTGAGNVYKTLYDRCIDFGSHPNERGLSSSMKIFEEGNETVHQVFYSHPGSPSHEHALASLQMAGVCSLNIFQFVFPEKFLLLGINNEINEMIASFKKRSKT